MFYRMKDSNIEAVSVGFVEGDKPEEFAVVLQVGFTVVAVDPETAIALATGIVGILQARIDGVTKDMVATDPTASKKRRRKDAAANQKMLGLDKVIG